jgi:hypothetical protein
MPVILATWKAESRSIAVQDQPRQIVTIIITPKKLPAFPTELMFESNPKTPSIT